MEYSKLDLEHQLEEAREEIKALENDKDCYMDQSNKLYDEVMELREYKKDIENFMFKLKLDKCYTKELEQFIEYYGHDIF